MPKRSNSLPQSAEREPGDKLTGAAGQTFPVVGVGASTGGLDAFTKLLKNLPADTGMAFVLVQHLDPKHLSLLPELLARATPMPVVEISDGARIAPNHAAQSQPGHAARRAAPDAATGLGPGTARGGTPGHQGA